MIRQNSAYVLRTIGDLHILVLCRRNVIGKWMIFLNDTAAYIWDLITASGIEREQLLCDLQNQYQLDKNGTDLDAVHAFIDQMIQQGIFLEEFRSD